MTGEQHEALPATFWEKLTWRGVVQYFQYHVPRLLGRPFPSEPLAERPPVRIPLPQIPSWRCYDIDGVKLEICDYVSSGAACHIARELGEGCYGLAKIPFDKGDVVIDIGGHERRPFATHDRQLQFQFWWRYRYLGAEPAQ